MLDTYTQPAQGYRITYITLDDLQLHFETQVAVAGEDGELILLEAPTPPAERRAL
ncbi:type III secretion system co-regulatory protein PtrC, partial [Pseudomonas citronellolis]|uniref:type III secretion system co-regulatory protein PtrC n=1 Tax=Pseudomonas citronellolis TaxID=53408 RepID=UPI0023E46D2D